MDEKNVYGVKYEVDIEDLKLSMDEAKKKVKLANAEFNESSSKLDNWAESVEGVQAKIKQLNTVLDAEKQKLLNSQNSYNKIIDSIDKYASEIDDLKKKKQEAIKTYGAESDQVKNLDKEIAKLERSQKMAMNSADRLKISISNQQATVNKTERSLKDYEGQLEEVEQAQKQADKSGKSLADELKNIRDKSEEAGEGVSKMSSGFTVVKGAISGLIANGISSLISGLGSIISESKETIENMGKLETAFTKSEVGVKAGKEAYKEMVGVLGEMDQSVEAVNHLAKLTKSQEELSKWTNIATGVYAEFGDSLPLEGLTESANETAKVGKVTGSLADALNWAGVSEDEFNKKLEAANSEKERSQLITETLNKLYSDSANTYRETNKELIENRKATAEMQESQARLGEALLPVETGFKKLGSTILNTFMDLATGQMSLDQFLTKVDGFAKNVVAKVSELAPQLLQKGTEMLLSLSEGFATGYPKFMSKWYDILQGIGDWLSEQAPTFIEKGFEMLSNLVTGIIDSIPVMIAKLPTIITTFANIINDNFPTILAKGGELLWKFITGILGAIPDLIANIPQIIEAIVSVILAFNWLNLGKNIMDFFANGIKGMVTTVGQRAKEIFDTIINNLKELPSKLLNMAKDGVGKIASGFSSGLGNVGSTIRNIFNTVINGIKELPGRLLDYARNSVNNIINGITGGQGGVSGAISGIANSIINGVTSLPGRMLSIGGDIVRGLMNGISDMTGWITSKIGGFTNSVLKSIKGFFGIKSPSRKTYYFGEMLVEGLGNAIADGTNSLVNKSKSMAGKIMDSMKKDLSESIEVQPDIITRFKGSTANAVNGLKMFMGGNDLALAGAGGTNVNNVTFNQYITSPKALDNYQIYKNTKKQLRDIKKVWKGGK